MSRDLKNEYEAMLDQEIPDLWSRIEPRLAEKTGQGSAAQAMMHAEAVQGVQNGRQTAGVQEISQEAVQGVQNRQQTVSTQAMMQEAGIQGAGEQTVFPGRGTEAKETGEQAARGQTAQQEKKTRRHLRRSTIAVWTSLAAACVCLALILPAWTGGQKGEDRTNQIAADTSSATDNGASFQTDGMQESACEDAYEPESPADMEAGTNNTAADDDSVTLFENADASPQDVPVEEDAALQESDGNGQTQGDDQGDMSAPAEEESDENGKEASELLSQYTFYGGIVEVWQTKEGFFYRMELEESAGDDMPAGSKIVIFRKKGLLQGISGAQDMTMTEGNFYRVETEPEIVDGETRYVLIGCEEVDAE